MTASPDATYAYNGAEQLTSETVNGTTTNYTYAGAAQDQLLTATTGSTITSYTYGQSGVDTATTNGATSRVLANPSGQVLNLTDANGDSAAFVVDGIGNQVGALTDTGSNAFTVTYDPYGTGGVTTGSTSPFWTQNPFGFKTGARASQTQNDIIRFGLRWYLPTTGTWTQRDTLDSPLDPNNADRYAYAGDDPTNGSDPSGQLGIGAGPGIHACYVVCINAGIEFGNEGIHPYLGGGVGPDVGVSGDAGVTVNKKEGVTGGINCRASAGPVGVYGEVGANDSDKSYYGGGGYAPGAELGCAAEVNYVF
jgi:RHS repeat-associated protein